MSWVKSYLHLLVFCCLRQRCNIANYSFALTGCRKRSLCGPQGFLLSSEHSQPGRLKPHSLNILFPRCTCAKMNSFINNESHRCLWLWSKLNSGRPLGFLSVNSKVRSCQDEIRFSYQGGGHPKTCIPKSFLTLCFRCIYRKFFSAESLLSQVNAYTHVGNVPLIKHVWQ